MTAPRRSGMRRAIVILPGAFTSGNLFFGIWSIVLASRGQYVQASWFIVLAGLMDVLDGRVARMSRTGTAFGAELDSLVDAISFGVAPALLVFFHTFSRGGEWAWLLCFLYVLAVVLRLARFNVEQAGHAKSQFFGLPSPAAGMTLATFYPFSQTAWFQANLAEAFPTARALALLVVVVSLLMVSHVPYPTWPRVDLRSVKGVLGAAHLLGIIAAAVYIADYFFFPYGLLYLGFGLGRAVFLGFLDRLPDRDPLRDEEDDGRRPVDDQLHPRHLPFRIGRPRRSGGGSA